MKFALIGATLPALDYHSNAQRTSELRNLLINKGLTFVGVQNISSNITSQLFLVESTDESQVILMAQIFGQKAILVSDEHKNMEVVSTRSNGRTALGKLGPVSKDDAAKAKFCITFNESGKSYYYVTKKGA